MKAWKVKFQSDFCVNRDGAVEYYGYRTEYVPAASAEEARRMVESKTTPTTDVYRWRVVEAPQKVIGIKFAGEGFLTAEEIVNVLRAAVAEGKLEVRPLPHEEDRKVFWVEGVYFLYPVDALYYLERGYTPTLGMSTNWIFVDQFSHPSGWEEVNGELVWSIGWSRSGTATMIDRMDVASLFA